MFSADYFSARDRFRRAARTALPALALDVPGPRGEALSIDIAWIGDCAPSRVLLVTSGIHGVEGFAGSAVQCACLGAPIALPPGCAVVLVHALNPWGFAYSRRVNENNVDLNRNFLDSPADYAGAAPEYRRLDALLNPPSTPAADAFYLRAGWHVARHGLNALRQTVAAGQYAFPRGLFFGGERLEQGPQRFLRWLEERCAGAAYLLAIDLHSGIGPFGALTLLAARGMQPESVASLSQTLQVPLAHEAGVPSAGAFHARGAMLGALGRILPGCAIDALTAEFGTYGGVRLLHALREENRWHHYGSGSLDHPAKRRLVAMFNPDSVRWREAVIAQGTRLIARALQSLAAAQPDMQV